MVDKNGRHISVGDIVRQGIVRSTMVRSVGDAGRPAWWVEQAQVAGPDGLVWLGSSEIEVVELEENEAAAFYRDFQ